jgi:hypothetical protein
MPANLNQSKESPNSNPTHHDKPSGQDEDGFIPVNHEDVDMQDGDDQSDEEELPPHHHSPQSLQLQRLSHTGGYADQDEDEDSEDDRDIMNNHPLLSMLTGRMQQRRRGSSHKWDSLHPENQALSVKNVEQCTALEEEAFPPEERASREKVRRSLRFDRSMS